MPLLSKPVTGRPSIKLGERYDAQVEMHYHGKPEWWSQGYPWLKEVRVATTQQISAELHDPANRPLLRCLKLGWSNEKIVEWLVTEVRRSDKEYVPSDADLHAATARVQRLRKLAEHANDQHVIRLIGIESATKEEERILAFVDQNPFTEAPQRRFTETEKGWRHKQLVTFGAMALIDAIFLWGMVSFASAPVTAGAQVQQISTQAVSNLAYILIAAGWVSTTLALYMLMARRTLVSSWEIAPLVHSTLVTHSEVVYLQNSQDEPSSEFLARVMGFDPATISSFTTAVLKFQADAISTHQEQSQSLRSELDTAELVGIEDSLTRINLRALGGRRTTPVYEANANPWLLVAIVTTIAVVVTIAVVLAAGG